MKVEKKLDISKRHIVNAQNHPFFCDAAEKIWAVVENGRMAELRNVVSAVDNKIALEFQHYQFSQLVSVLFWLNF